LKIKEKIIIKSMKEKIKDFNKYYEIEKEIGR